MSAMSPLNSILDKMKYNINYSADKAFYRTTTFPVLFSTPNTYTHTKCTFNHTK